MGRKKLWERLMAGRHDASFRFADMRLLLERQGFECRIRGDHFIYSRQDVAEIVNIQPLGSSAKAYQVKQVRAIFIQYRLTEA